MDWSATKEELGSKLQLFITQQKQTEDHSTIHSPTHYTAKQDNSFGPQAFLSKPS